MPGSMPLRVGRSGLIEPQGGIALFRGGRAAVARGAFDHLCSWIVSHAKDSLQRIYPKGGLSLRDAILFQETHHKEETQRYLMNG